MRVCQFLQAADVPELLGDPNGAVTVLAPTDTAFEKIPAADREALLADSPALSQVGYHLVCRTMFCIRNNKHGQRCVLGTVALLLCFSVYTGACTILPACLRL